VNPALARHEFAAAGMSRLAADHCPGQHEQQNPSAKFFHTGTVIEFVTAASVRHVFPQNAMPAQAKYLKGQLLLDSGELQGSFFQRTVLLICQHDAEGAFGLVLNRASGSKAGEMIVADLPETLKEQQLFVGGPVQPTALSFLHSVSFIPDATILPNLSLGHSLDTLVDLGASFSPTQKVKLFAGYAGWSPGQLESEMKRKAWLTHPASLELIFDTPAEQLWQTVLRSKGGWQNRLLAQSPEDLSWN
jgi:putative transcriptional regulator